MTQNTHKKPLIVSLVCVALGLFLLLIAVGVFPASEAQPQAPDSIIALCGVVFIIAGCMAYLGTRSRVNDLLAAILCLIFGIVGAWVSLFSSSDGFSGGIPFVSNDSNVAIARVVFGAGSLMCFAISAWALKRFLRPAN